MTTAERELVIAIINSCVYASDMKKAINAIPITDDIQKIGTWGRSKYIQTLDARGECYMIREVKCSNCGAKIQLLDYDNFCPRCGSNNTFHD